jgi:hypothetical protein
MNQHPCWNRIEWHGVDHGWNPFFDHSNLTFNLEDVLISTRQVECWRSIHRPHPIFKRSEFTITLDEHNLKTLLKVIAAHTFQSIEDG